MSHEEEKTTSTKPSSSALGEGNSATGADKLASRKAKTLGLLPQDRQKLFNIAADLEIHFLLTDEGLKAPFVLPHDPNWKGLSAEEIYERLGKRNASSQVRESHQCGTEPPLKPFSTTCRESRSPCACAA